MAHAPARLLTDRREPACVNWSFPGRDTLEAIAIPGRRVRCAAAGYLVVKFVSHCRLAFICQFAVPDFQPESTLFWLPKQSPVARM